MANTLFEQLKKTGLVDDKQARQARKEKHLRVKQQKGKKGRPEDESKLRAQRAQTEKAARDRELNRQRKQAAEQKALAAQIRQLIEMNRIDHDAGEIGFNFTAGGKVRQLYVTEKLQSQLARGQLAIVRLDSAYELVPAAVAEKLKQRDPSCVIYCDAAGAQAEASDADDPYAEYQVPDDLMW